MDGLSNTIEMDIFRSSLKGFIRIDFQSFFDQPICTIRSWEK